MSTFLTSDFAHCGEALYIPSSLFFHGMLCFHIQFLGHLIPIIGIEIVIERFVVGCNGTTDSRSMSGKDCCHLWHKMLQVKCSQTSLPFMSLKNHIVILSQFKETIEPLHHLTCTPRKHKALIIITV